MPELLLEIAAHGVTAILATWLGLLVITRARQAAGASVFSFLCLLLVAWSLAIIVQRISNDTSVLAPMNLVEDTAAFLLPAATAHIAIVVAFEGQRSRLATAVLVVGYAVGALAILQATLDPTHEIGFAENSFAPLGFPPAVMGWAFAGIRLAVWGAGVVYLVAGLRQAGEDRARQRQLQFALATVVLGVIGAMLRILPESMGGPRWVGVSLITVATVLATYVVLAQHLFLTADAAGRAVRWSLAVGLGVVAYVGLLVTLETAAAAWLGIDVPIVTALALVVTLAIFDPLSDRLRRLAAGRPEEVDQDRLMRALGNDPLLSQRPDLAIPPALARLVRTFELSGAAIVGPDGAVRAGHGSIDRDDPRAIRLPLDGSGNEHGQAVFGPKRNGLAFTPSELGALTVAAGFLGASLRLAAHHEAQASALAELRRERDTVQSRGTALQEALADATTPSDALHVYALGSLRAERNGEVIRRWGGEKAGSRQAEALFAFLFDRGDRGAAKDEILELIWPDVDLDRADVAFHRTMLGLRTMLRPGRRSRAESAIGFHNDRYRINLSVVAWSDVTEFERLIASAGAGTTAEGLRALEQARALYRGDYLDDCPYYGDSAEVEERRSGLRSRFVDLLVELGERYVERGDRPAAAACFRQAQSLADDELPRVDEALRRLATPRAAESA